MWGNQGSIEYQGTRRGPFVKFTEENFRGTEQSRKWVLKDKGKIHSTQTGCLQIQVVGKSRLMLVQ